MRLLVAPLLWTACVKPRVVADEGECRAERWDVKLGYDEAASAVDVAHPQPVDIRFLRSQPAPPHIPDHL
jgi:hypothetical protein